jgi:hypothetical protein
VSSLKLVIFSGDTIVGFGIGVEQGRLLIFFEEDNLLRIFFSREVFGKLSIEEKTSKKEKTFYQ